MMSERETCIRGRRSEIGSQRSMLSVTKWPEINTDAPDQKLFLNLCSSVAIFHRPSELDSFPLRQASAIRPYLHTSSVYTSDAAPGVLRVKNRPTRASALPFPALHHSALPTIAGGLRNADIDYRNSYLTQRTLDARTPDEFSSSGRSDHSQVVPAFHNQAAVQYQRTLRICATDRSPSARGPSAVD